MCEIGGKIAAGPDAEDALAKQEEQQLKEAIAESLRTVETSSVGDEFQHQLDMAMAFSLGVSGENTIMHRVIEGMACDQGHGEEGVIDIPVVACGEDQTFVRTIPAGPSELDTIAEQAGQQLRGAR